MAKQGVLTLSMSKAGSYINCPKYYFLHYVMQCERKTDYPRLMGSTVHQFVRTMYSSKKNPLYYSTLKKAQGAWFYKWNGALEQNRLILREQSKKRDDEFGVSGLMCVTHYWNENIDKPRPLEVEKRYKVRMFPKVWFVGIFDQIRAISIESIAKIRPELIINGKLIDGYDPVVLVDLKTGRESYNPRYFRPDITNEELAAFQFDLHENLQITTYYWLYYQVYGKLPVAFYWYHLRDGKAFKTYRNVKDFQEFLYTMRHVTNGIMNEAFTMRIEKRCKYCDYNKQCAELRPDRPLMATEPSDGIDFNDGMTVWPQVISTGAKQLRLKFPSTTKEE